MTPLIKRVLLVSAIFGLGSGAAELGAQAHFVQAENLLRKADVAAEAAARGVTAAAMEVARLHLEVAELYADAPLKRVESMRTAALYMSHTRPAQAAQIMTDAADRALAAGDVITAANSYLDAASMLIQSNGSRGLTAEGFGRVQNLINQARNLADSPLLSNADRERILRRSGPSEGHFAG
jgi:hypothetical protein